MPEPTPPPAELRPMSLGDIVERSLSLYLRRFREFVKIVAVVYVPYAVLVALLLGAGRSLAPVQVDEELPDIFAVVAPRLGSAVPWWSHALASVSRAVQVDLGGLWGGLAALVLLVVVALAAFLLFLGLVYPLCSAALLVNISAGLLGEDIGARESYRRAWRRLGRMLFAQMLVSLAVLFGLLLCFFPGLLFALWFALTPTVALLEDVSASGALSRSRTLMRENLGRGAALFVLVTLLALLATTTVAKLLHVLPWPSPFWEDFLGVLLDGLVLPVPIAAAVLFYYDLRVRKEGFELGHLRARMELFRT